MDFLTKPFCEREFLHALGAALERDRIAARLRTAEKDSPISSCQYHGQNAGRRWNWLEQPETWDSSAKGAVPRRCTT
jgi:hypothetical protein